MRHDADDLVELRTVRGIGFGVDHDPFADRILSLERHVGQGLIDDHHFRGSGRIVFVEGPAADEIDPEGGEIITLHDFVVGRGLLAWIGRRRAFRHEIELPAAQHRRVR